MSTVQRWSGREARALREALRMSTRRFAAHLGVSERTVTNWEAGTTACPRPEMQAALDTVLDRATDAVKARFKAGLQIDDVLRADSLYECGPVTDRNPLLVSGERRVILQRVERLRHGLADSITENALTEASIEDWESTVARYGYASRDHTADALLPDLADDLVALQRALSRCRTSRSLRRLTRVAAQMSGLMCLTLIKLDERAEFRRWARIARIAADEADDAEVRSWVRAHEAYGHYYSGDLSSAIVVAREAQSLPSNSCVGGALAAALEARAQALLGKRHEAGQALRCAEVTLASLDAESIIPSAFGYSEAQLRFHQGNTYTHLHDTRSAWSAQDRALELCPDKDYMDRAFILLDRASCLAFDGDINTAARQARDTLLELTEKQRTGIISVRANEVYDAFSENRRCLPTARELRDVLMLTSHREEKDH